MSIINSDFVQEEVTRDGDKTNVRFYVTSADGTPWSCFYFFEDKHLADTKLMGKFKAAIESMFRKKLSE